MSRICEHCGKGALKGHSRSHSNIATIVHRMPNLQRITIAGNRLRLCASCIKTIRRNTTVHA
ncbi:MAG: 50S ribosomal protein L28 [Parcubacteria group bacterium]|nr:50S ribosomal protein L28 [Parcubacteria group bacterium]